MINLFLLTALLALITLVSTWPVPLHPLILDIIDHPLSHLLYLLGVLYFVDNQPFQMVEPKMGLLVPLLLSVLYILIVHARETVPYHSQVEEEDPERLQSKI